MVKPKALLGYTLGIRRDAPAMERPGKTGGEKFAQARVKSRMAGDILNLTQTPETLPLPRVPGGTLINSQSTGQLSPQPMPNVGGAELRTPELPQ